MRHVCVLGVFFLICSSLGAQHVSCDVSNKKAKKLYDKAREQISARNLDAAETYLLDALEIEEAYAKAYFLLAKIKFRQRKYKASGEYYAQLVELCPEYKQKVSYEQGKAALYLKDYSACATHFNSYLDGEKVDPRMAPEVDSLYEHCVFYRDIYDNPVPFDPKPLQNISTKYGEYLPILTPDNEYLFYIRSQPSRRKTAISGTTYDELFTMSQFVNDTFTRGEPLKKPFNMGSNEGGASLTIDNKEMFITICGRPDGKGSCDLYYTHKEGEYWAPLVNMNEFNDSINTQYWESQVTVSSKGNTLYFAAYRPEGYGGYDIYRIERDTLGMWSAPINLGPQVNTAGDEKSPFIHVDDRTLYFSSTGHLGLGDFDIFITRREEGGAWAKPRNIGHPVNSEKADLGFFVSTDGQQGYFASNKLEGAGSWDIYSFNLYKEARPQKVLFLKGTVEQNEFDEPEDVKMSLTNMKTNEEVDIPINQTGEFVYTQVVDEDQMLTVQKKGHMYQTEYFSAADTTPLKPKKLDFKLSEIENGSTFRVDEGMEDQALLFDTDSYDLKKGSKSVMRSLINFLRMNPEVRIAVHGHTDDVGSAADNLKLSQQRAEAVKTYLISQGISQGRVSSKGFGESRPVSSNATEQGRAKNRRTEIRIVSN